MRCLFSSTPPAFTSNLTAKATSVNCVENEVYRTAVFTENCDAKVATEIWGPVGVEWWFVQRKLGHDSVHPGGRIATSKQMSNMK